MDRRLILLNLLAMTGTAGNASAKASLSNTRADAGLRDLLTTGTASAVTRVSKTDGYWGDDKIRIPLPKSMASLQKILKPLGQSGPLDEVHLRMNRAAEAAAPVARGLFVDAIKAMTVKDAVGIIRGGSTSGTAYLQRTTTPRLTTAFTPPMENALQSTGAVDYLDRAVRRNNLQSLVKTDAKTWLGTYAVGFALNGLFHYVGVEETAIRRDPAKRTTELLKSIFG